MKRQITFWKNTGHPNLRGKTVELFKVSWDEETGEWYRDEEGKYWGMYRLEGGEEVRRLTRPPEDMGEVVDIQENEAGEAKAAYFHNPEPDASGVDNLEAKDITVTPEGLDLGEDEGQ